VFEDTAMRECLDLRDKKKQKDGEILVIKLGRMIDGASSTHGSCEECIQNFSRRTGREETTWKTKT